MTRPLLTSTTSVESFYAYYWLKEELVTFCRQNQISTSGSKPELTLRVAAALSGKPITAPKKQRATVKMPTEFCRETILGKNWRCSQPLRIFLEQEIGSHFHFDEVMRNLIHYGEGKTLAEVILQWTQTQKQPRQNNNIAPQFEYNQFIRDYFKLHAQSNFKEAVHAWNDHKSSPKFEK